jgi:hypothetical protein
MSAEVLAVRDKVQRYLAEVVGAVKIDSDGDFTFRAGSSQMWISVRKVEQHGSYTEFVAVKVFANTNNRVPASPALFEYVATEGRYQIGALRCFRKEDGVRVWLEHTLMGTFLDPAELYVTINYIGEIADWVDDEIRRKFGGVLYHAGGN